MVRCARYLIRFLMTDIFLSPSASVSLVSATPTTAGVCFLKIRSEGLLDSSINGKYYKVDFLQSRCKSWRPRVWSLVQVQTSAGCLDTRCSSFCSYPPVSLDSFVMIKEQENVYRVTRLLLVENMDTTLQINVLYWDLFTVYSTHNTRTSLC